ncbi:Vitamin B12 import ATP-binding protein BtuD [Candidatus Lokiarchaeum ossiferum]
MFLQNEPLVRHGLNRDPNYVNLGFLKNHRFLIEKNKFMYSVLERLKKTTQYYKEYGLVKKRERRKSMAVIETINLQKFYSQGKISIKALAGVNAQINEGEFVAILGPSGSGKSTFLNMIGALDKPTEGVIKLSGKDISKMTKDELAEQRQRIGFVFQSYNLIERLSALENVELAMSIQKIPKEERRSKSLKIMSDVGLADRSSHKPSELSGGQKQRVAIARALAQDPYFLLLDEPTGNVDTHTRDDIMDLINTLNSEFRKTIVIVTHDPIVAKYAHRTIYFLDGKISQDITVEEFETPKDLLPMEEEI